MVFVNNCKYKIVKNLGLSHRDLQDIYLVKCEGCGHECFGEVNQAYEELPFHVKIQVKIEDFMLFYDKEEVWYDFN